MIKEKPKKTKYNYKKTKTQIIVEYLRTVLCAFFIALVITTSLAIRARNEMIKDISNSAQEQNKLDKKLAMEIISQTNLIKDLKNKTYAVCMHAGDIYETAGDYVDAQKAYELAIDKSKYKNYKPYQKLISVLVAQEKFNDAQDVLDNLKDLSDVKLIKFKTRAYITIGDKYYSIGKFLSAAKAYESADFYYNKLTKKDNVIDSSIKNRIINSYIQVADIMVRNGLNTEAARFLRKAEKYNPEEFIIRYKLAIVLSDLDPEMSVKYFEALISERPQEIDYGVYNRALMKAANIADLDNRPTKAKYYRYKIHSVDMFINRKVIYKNDVEINLKSFKVKKVLFNYPLKATYEFLNISNSDILNLTGDFVLCKNGTPIETISKVISNKTAPLYTGTLQPNEITINFNRKIYTKKELSEYTIRIYLYKDKKYKTPVWENSLPEKSF